MISDYLDELTEINLWIGSTISDHIQMYFSLKHLRKFNSPRISGDSVEIRVNNVIRHSKMSCIEEIKRKVNE